VRRIASATGKSIALVDVSEDAARAGMLKAGVPAELVDAVLELMALAKAGRAATLTDTVERLLGRAPRTFDVWVDENASAFGGRLKEPAHADFARA
jgi:hypothetical protein